VKEHADTSARQNGYRRRLEGAVQGFCGDPALCSHLAVKKGRILLPDKTGTGGISKETFRDSVATLPSVATWQ